MRHNYKPAAVKVPVTVDDVVAEQANLSMIRYKMGELRRDTSAKLKRYRKELLAKQAWIKRHEHLLPERAKPVSPFDNA